MFFDHYPYTNFHNVNLDWVLQAVKAWGLTVEANDQAFQDLKAANESFKAYVTNYLQDLDVSEEINDKLDQMLASGVLTPYFAPYVQGYVNSWLNSHVTPTSPALDNTLTLSGAAARADATGKRLKDLAYIDALSTPEVVAALNRSQVLPGYRVQGITYDYDGHYYVCGGSVDENGSGVIVKMTKPDFTDAEITEIPQLGHANDITYYNGYLYVCTVGGGDAPQWGIYKINANDFTDKTLISNAPENTIGISYRQGDFWILAPYRIYRTTDFSSYEVVVANTNDLMTAYGIPTSGRISQTIFRAAGYLIGWVCSFVFEDRHYGALTFFNSTGEPVAFKMFPAYHSEIQGAVYADMSIYLLADGDLVNVFRMDPRNLSYVQLKAGDDLNDFTGRGTLYSTGSNVSAELINSPSSGEGFTVQVDRLGVYNTIQTARTNSGRELYRVKSFSAGTWGEWIEPAAEVSQIEEDLNSIYHKEYEKILYTLSNASANLFSIYSADYLSGKGYSQNTGKIVNSGNNCISGYIPVKNGDYFKVMVDGKNIFNTSIDGQVRKVAYYNSSKVWQKTESYYPVETNPDAIKMLYDGYIRVGLRKTDQIGIFVSSVLKDKLVDLMIFAGQSNMAGRGTTDETFPDTAPAVIVGAGYEFRSITDPTRLYPITEPFGYAENAPDDSSGICDETKKTGDMVAAFVNAYYTNNGNIPTVCVSASEGGSSSTEWLPGTGNNFVDLSNRLNTARQWLVDNGYAIRHQYCAWCQGESDGDDIAAGRETFEEYKTRARAIFNGLIALGLEKVLLVRIGNHNSGSSTRYTDIIQWQTEEAQTNDALVMVSCDFAGMRSKGMMKDDFHYYQIGYNIAGNSAGVNAALFATTGKEPTMYDPESNNLYYSHKN